jgi:hypothetical protein
MLVHVQSAEDDPKPEIQMNFAGSQMASYMHRPLLNKYAANRSQKVTIHEFSNVFVDIPYKEFELGTSCLKTRFSAASNHWPSFIADTSVKDPTINTTTSPFLSLPVYLYELAIVYNEDGFPPDFVLKLKMDELIAIFTSETIYWNEL